MKNKLATTCFISLIAATAQSNPQLIPFASDAETGISTSKVYTHAVNFGTASGTLAINGVTFINSNSANNNAQIGWRGFPPSAASGSDQHINTPAGNAIRTLLTSLNYNINNGTMVVTGLTPEILYEIRFYNRSWTGSFNDRLTRLTFKPDDLTSDAYQINADASKIDTILAYRYRASASGELQIVINQLNSSGTYHLYGFSNEKQIQVEPLPVTAIGDSFATFNGNVIPNGIPAAISVQIKPDNGDNSEPAWQAPGVATLPVLGTFSTPGPVVFTPPAGTLFPNTTYAFRFVLDNNTDVVPSMAGTFTTRAATPVIWTQPATNVTSTSASAMAWVDYIGPGMTSGAIVELFWGDNDGEDNAGAWDHGPVTIGSTHGLGAVAHTLNGLANGTKYFYRHSISNGAESAWATESAEFTTLGLPVFGEPVVAPYSESVFFGVKLAAAGISAKTVTLFFGENPASLPSVKTWDAAQSDTYFDHIIKGLANGQTYYYAFRAETEMPDAPSVVRVVETPVTPVQIAANNVTASTINWSGAGGDRKWGNPQNWNGGVLPGPYNRARIPAATAPSNDKLILLVDGPFVVGDVQLENQNTYATFLADAPDASITLLTGSVWGGKETVFAVPVFIGNSGSFEASDNYVSGVNLEGFVHDHGLGLSINGSGNQNRWFTMSGPVDIGGKITVMNRGGTFNNAFTLTNAAGVYLDSRLSDGGNETGLTIVNAAPISHRVAPGIALGSVRSGGGFRLEGSAEMDIVEAFAALDLQSGRLGVTAAGANNSGDYETTISFDAVQRGEGACLLVGASNGGRVIANNAANTDGIWQPWAFRDTHYTRLDTDGSIIRVPDSAYIELPAAGADSASLYKMTQAQLTLTAPTEVRGLRLYSSAVQTLELGAHTLTVNSGALTAEGGANKTIQASNGGALVFAGDDVIFNFYNSGAKMVVDAPMEWQPPVANAPRPALIVPQLNHSGGLWLSGEDRIADYGALTCYAYYANEMRQLVLDGASDRTFHGPVSGAFDLAKRGSGTLRLNGESRMRQGSIHLWEGTLMVGNPSIPGIYLFNSNATLSVAADVVYGGFPARERTDPGVTIGGFGTFAASMNGQYLKSGSRIAPGDAETIGTLTFTGEFGNTDNNVDWLLKDLFYDIKLDGAQNDRVHVANRFRKPTHDSTWTFVVRDLSNGKNSVSGKTYVLFDWTGTLENSGADLNLAVEIHPSSQRRIYTDANTQITLDPVNKQILLTGLKSYSGGVFMVR